MSIDAVLKGFQNALNELQEASVLRESEVKRLYNDDLARIESFVTRLEDMLQHVENKIQQEVEDIETLERAIDDAKVQRGLLKASLADTVLQRPKATASGDLDRTVTHQSDTSIKQVVGPRYVTTEELNSVGSYMRGRLTLDRVNAALDELLQHAEKNRSMVIAAKKNKTAGIDRKHAMWLLSHVAKNASVPGKYWVLEQDLKNGHALKKDNTSKSILTLLRHLGRISESRLHVDGETVVVYCLL